MKFALLAIGLLAAGVVGGVTADYLRSDALPDIEGGSPDRLTARVDNLEEAITRLTEEVRLLRTAAPVPAAPAPMSEVPAVAAEPLPADENEITARVLATIEERAKKEREEKEQRKEAVAAERAEAGIRRLEENLGLTPNQVEEFAEIIEDRRKAMIDVRNRLRRDGNGRMTGEGIATVREEMKKIRDDTDAKLKELLTEEQYEKFHKKKSSQDKGGRRPGRSRRR